MTQSTGMLLYLLKLYMMKELHPVLNLVFIGESEHTHSETFMFKKLEYLWLKKRTDQIFDEMWKYQCWSWNILIMLEHTVLQNVT